MEQEGIKYLSQKTGKAIVVLEEMWDKAKQLTTHEFKIKHGDEGFNPIATGTMKRMLRIGQVDLKENTINDFLIILEGGVVVDGTVKNDVTLVERQVDTGSTKSVQVQYVKKQENGSFKTYNENFDYHEDGDPVFPVKTETYQNLIGRKVGQHWSKYVNEAIHSYVKNKKKDRFWIRCEDTGNMYKYVIPKKQL